MCSNDRCVITFTSMKSIKTRTERKDPFVLCPPSLTPSVCLIVPSPWPSMDVTPRLIPSRVWASALLPLSCRLLPSFPTITLPCCPSSARLFSYLFFCLFVFLTNKNTSHNAPTSGENHGVVADDQMFVNTAHMCGCVRACTYRRVRS